MVTAVQPSFSTWTPGPARVDHRLDRQNHASLEPGALPCIAEVGNLGIFVHGPADAVADKLTDDPESLGFTDPLNGGGNIAQTPPHLALQNGLLQRGKRHIEQLLRLGR